jgi:hypothetical protein
MKINALKLLAISFGLAVITAVSGATAYKTGIQPVFFGERTSTSTTESAVSEVPQKTLKERLAGKTAKEKANIKGAEIARVTRRGKAQLEKYEVEIKDLQYLDGGVQVLARAWNPDGSQIGFGADGTVDLERFKIYNPPVLVADGTKSIEIMEGLEYEVDNFREDPEAALLQTLDHIISVKKEKFGASKIVPGKIGNTTSTFYPDASNIDGYVKNDGTVWSTVQGAASGNEVEDTASTAVTNAKLVGSTYSIRRGVTLFDTSSLPDTDNITAATYSLYITTTTNVDNDGLDYMSVVGVQAIASDTALNTADYDLVGSSIDNPTELHATTQRKDVSSISTSAYLDWSLNATGVAYISKTSKTRLGTREGHDMTDSAISAAGEQGNAIIWSSSRESGTSQDPKLVVEHAASNVIQYDNAASFADDAEGSTVSVNLTINPDAKGVAIFMYDADGATHDTVTVGGVSATKIIEDANSGDIRVSGWYLANPSTGTVTITGTYSAGVTRRRIAAISHYGSGAVGAENSSNGGSSTSVSVAVTTTGDNSIIVDGFGNGGQLNVAVTGSNQTERYRASSSNPRTLVGSTQTTTAAGSYTGTVTQSPASGWAYVRFEIKEAGGGGAQGEEFLLVF